MEDGKIDRQIGRNKKEQRVCRDAEIVVNSVFTPASVLAASGSENRYYPENLKTGIDEVLMLGEALERAAAVHLTPGAHAIADDELDESQKMAHQALSNFDELLKQSASDHAVADQLTLADVYAASALIPLYQDVLGQDIQSKFPQILSWLQKMLENDVVVSIFGKEKSGCFSSWHCAASVIWCLFPALLVLSDPVHCSLFPSWRANQAQNVILCQWWT